MEWLIHSILETKLLNFHTKGKHSGVAIHMQMLALRIKQGLTLFHHWGWKLLKSVGCSEFCHTAIFISQNIFGPVCKADKKRSNLVNRLNEGCLIFEAKKYHANLEELLLSQLFNFTEHSWSSWIPWESSRVFNLDEYSWCVTAVITTSNL